LCRKPRRSGYYATVNASNNAVTGATKRTGKSAFSQLWIIAPMGDRFTLRSALDLNYLTEKPHITKNAMFPLSIFYSGGNASESASTNYVTISWTKEPEKYKDLIVRVAGYSAFFSELCKDVQDEIISRTMLDHF